MFPSIYVCSFFKLCVDVSVGTNNNYSIISGRYSDVQGRIEMVYPK